MAVAGAGVRGEPCPVRGRLIHMNADRTWLITWTCYGNWLPGDERGSVTSVRDRRPEDPQSLVRIEHDIPGEPYEDDIPEFEASARRLMKGPPIAFQLKHAELVMAQFLETAGRRAVRVNARVTA